MPEKRASDAADTSVKDAIVREGAGKAYQLVAQATAIAIQDATDNLRNINSISTTAMGAALAQFLETGKPEYAAAVDLAIKMADAANNNYKAIASTAIHILEDYPHLIPDTVKPSAL